MLKHLTGIKNNNMRKKLGQIDIDLGVAPPEVNTGLDLWNSGDYTTSTVNNFDWVELIDSVGNLVTIGFDGYNNYILAQGTALQCPPLLLECYPRAHPLVLSPQEF